MKRVRVSDHAVLRYLERHGGFEIEKLRRSMELRLTPLAQTGAARIKLDGLVFVLRRSADGGKTVASVLDPQNAIPRIERDDPHD
ncbi:hypothetical protein ACTTAI_13255 [Rhodobacter capsulatus]|uniref:hypothetical protein n=1 Tax=Rhodobacter capsulatus TaxID=1061 RepID=UPI004029046F